MTTKSENEFLDRSTATEYASRFKVLADATRIQIVSLLARRGEPMTVGQIVEIVDVSQSTVSAYLKALADVSLVLAEQHGTARYYRINEACVRRFPSHRRRHGPRSSPPILTPRLVRQEQADDRPHRRNLSGLIHHALAGRTPTDSCDTSETEAGDCAIRLPGCAAA